LARMTGLKNNALNSYAKKAGVVTPGQGKRNHRYSPVEVSQILDAIIANATDRTIVAKCETALRDVKSLLNR